MPEVCFDIELFNLVKAFNLVFGFPANGSALQHPDVYVGSQDDRAKVLTSKGDTTSTHKGFIYEVTLCNLCLIRHQKGQLVFQTCRSQVRPLF